MPNMLYHHHNVEKDNAEKQKSVNEVEEQKPAPKKRTKKQPEEGK